MLLVLVGRDGTAMVPRADTEFRPGDRLTFPGSPEEIEEMRRRFRPG